MSPVPDPASGTALVLIDLQNDNVTPTGAFAPRGAAAHAVGPAPRRARSDFWTGLAATICRSSTTRSCRSSAGTSAKQRADLRHDRSGVPPAGVLGWRCLQGLEPREGADAVRNRMSAFNGCGLDMPATQPRRRHGRGRRGLDQHGCRTQRSRCRGHGYRAFLVTDATSSISADWQHAAFSYALTKIAHLTTTADVLAQRVTKPA